MTKSWLILVVIIALLLTGCIQKNEELSNEEGTQVQESSQLNFDTNTTIEILNSVISTESIDWNSILEIMRFERIRGVARADIIEEEGRILVIEAESEDGVVYLIDVTRIDENRYVIRGIREQQTGRFIDVIPCGLGEDLEMERRAPRESVVFDVAATIAVLQPLLEEETLTEASHIIRTMQLQGVRGAVRAAWFDEPLPRSRLEVVSEDGTTYRFALALRTDTNGTTYFLRGISDIDADESVFHIFTLPAQEGVEWRNTWTTE